MIEAENISKFYGSFVAVRDVSFSIPEGQVVAFLGPNGAGKSTIMKILSGYLAPSEGRASIAGLDTRASRIEASRKLGYLPENGPLYPEMTPLELLQFFGEARLIDGPSLSRRIEHVSDLCALQDVMDRPIGKLSKGYRQRVGLAQALLHDPEVLIMDEPTAGLDPNQIREFRANLKKLGETKTILISTHILQEVEAVADRVLLVHEGKLAFDGSPEELMENGSLEEPFYRITGRGRPISAHRPEPPPPSPPAPAPMDLNATQRIDSASVLPQSPAGGHDAAGDEGDEQGKSEEVGHGH
jgi:ABC-2 type transport system ATP-binding protein